MGIIDGIISFCIFLFIGTKIQEETMDELYPCRPKGIIKNFLYNIKRD